MTDRFKGKSMVVTGAASGIGKTIARMAAEQGARVFVADINEEGGRQPPRKSAPLAARPSSRS